MSHLIVQTRDGRCSKIAGIEGMSVMKILRDAGIDEIEALCGGCCSCATCHVYVEGDPAARLSAISDDENDLLDCSEHRQGNSRLSCQITWTSELDGMKLIVAPEN